MAALVLAAAALAPPLAAGAGEPVVYLSPDGNPPATLPIEIQPANGVQLELYVDYEDGPGPSSTCMEPECVMCVNADGDETCGFDVLLQMQSDQGLFADFTPDQTDYVRHIDATGRTLRVNGLDTAGMPNPVLIGTLEVDAASANTLQIEVKGVHWVGAASQFDAIQERVIVKLPEPSFWLPLAGGVLGLAWLARRRRAG